MADHRLEAGATIGLLADPRLEAVPLGVVDCRAQDDATAESLIVLGDFFHSRQGVTPGLVEELAA